MATTNYLSCPFCGEKDFDKVGLKHHISMGYCEVYNYTLTVEEEQQARTIKEKQLKDTIRKAKNMGINTKSVEG